jgi:DNA polymerase-3 subunit alpha
MKFSHLHIHSHYSLLDGLPRIDDLIAKAKADGMESLALTDHGVMYGAIEFYQKARAAGLKPIIGVEAYLARNGRNNKRARIDERPYHLILLAKNKTGYQNLIKLTSLAHLEGYYYKPRIDWELLEKYHEGIIALSACLQGEIPVSVLNGDEKKTEELILKYRDLFGKENFYLELQNHPNLKAQGQVNLKLVEFSRKLDIPIVATNDIHYLNPEDDEAQDVLLCLQTKKKRDDKDRMSMMGEDFSFKSTAQMAADFKDYPDAISNTQKIIEACNVEIELGKITLPYFAVPGGITPEEYLKELCAKGLEERYGINIKETFKKQIDERLNYELEIISKTEFASYFLIVQDFVNWAKDQGIVVGPGRGSAAGSLVSFLIKITNIDPLKHDLLFERFLNPARISMPDIDLDFADTRRDEVLKYVEAKYGQDHVAQIITFGTMAARAVIRDVGRVLDLPYSYCDHVAKLIPPQSNLSEALNIVPEFKEIYDNDLKGKKLIDTALKLEGVARHSSTHACGVVITKEPLDNYIPLQFASSDDKTVISQYSLHPIEDLGLLKMDFLGLKNLTILENTLDVIEKTAGLKIKLDEIPLDDAKTFKLLQNAETTGVFQFESSGMKRYLKELKPTIFEDLIAMVALYRPGPMEWIPDFIAGKHGKKITRYLHPKLRPILEKTYGVAVYQEQIMQIARDLAGFSLGEADILRKAVGKKIEKLLKEQKTKFVAGCQKNGISKDVAEKVFAFIEPFAGYGFNRAHAACYALIAYLTAYLKANWPVHFMASLLTSEGGDTDRIAIEVEECKQMGIEVLPPDINESYSTFTAVVASLAEGKPRIRFGLSAIKNVGEHITKVIIHERKSNGPFKDLEDWLTRIRDKDLNKKSVESLIKSGSLDNFGERNQMLTNIEKILEFTRDIKKETENGQSNLFGMFPAASFARSLKLEDAPPIKEKQKLSWEKELLGLYISSHPFRDFATALSGRITPLADLNAGMASQSVKIAGVITTIKKVITKNNETMLFVKIEDTIKSVEILVFSKLYRQKPNLWVEDRVIIASGKISDKEGEVKLLCDDAEELNMENIDQIIKGLQNRNDFRSSSNGQGYVNNSRSDNSAYRRNNGMVLVKLPASIDASITDKLKSIFMLYPGQLKVCLVISKDNLIKKVETNFSVNFTDDFKNKIEQMIGLNSVKILNA